MPESPDVTVRGVRSGRAPAQMFDPRATVLALFVTGVVMLAYGDAGSFSVSRAAFAALALVLLLTARLWGVAAAFAIVYALAAAADALLLPASEGMVALVVAAATGMVLRLLPGLALAVFIVRTTSVSAFIAAMQSARVPKTLTIPLAVMLRFFPVITEARSRVNDAMRLRGLSGRGWRHPLLALQWRFVPLLIGVTRAGDELATAALSRGLSAPGPRTSLIRTRFGIAEVVLTAIVLSLAAWHLTGMRR